ncbi:MAG: C39 family peptidase [Armatimonadetes bacterium]|nr:C39 family peptidase [Anaerolineae bacterium]
MSERLEDTRPRPVVRPNTRPEVPAPPKLLLVLVIGVFALGILGTVGVVLGFRVVLQPAQQERVINELPFMRAFLPPGPGANDTLPTLQPDFTNSITANDLLNRSFAVTSTPADAAETLTPTETATIAATATTMATATVAATATPDLPTATAASAAVLPTALPVTDLVAQSTGLLTGIQYSKQTWNNCGPANITMALSYYGWTRDQDFAAQFLKWGREDKNVNPVELVSFVNEQAQVKALTRIGGDLNLIKLFISNGIPVIIETGYMPEGYDWIGHYQTVVGYDDATGVFYINDSFLGPSTVETYSFVDSFWRHFNRRFIIVYKPDDEALVARILGNLADPDQAAQHALEVAAQEGRQNPSDPYVFFNIGSAYAALGDYELAAAGYDLARQKENPPLPFRMLWYQFGMFEAYYHVGRYDDVIALAESNLLTTGDYVEEIHYWYGQALAAQGKTTEAMSAFRQALRLKPNYEAAQTALDALQ